MNIHTLSALKDNFIYVLSHKDQCAVVDPGEAAPVLRFLEHKKLALTHILLTHHHPDHIGGVADLVRGRDVQIWASEYDRERIPGVTHPVREGRAETLFGEPVEILEVPGHTLGQVCYYLPKSSALFVGDTLFSGGCGRLFEGTAEQMFTSLQKIKRLPVATRIYFGHEYTLRNLEFIKQQSGHISEDLFRYEQQCRNRLSKGEPTTPTTLAQELKINPFITSETVETFREWRSARDGW